MIETLGFRYKEFQTSLANLNEQFLPCLFITSDQILHILFKREDKHYVTFSE